MNQLRKKERTNKSGPSWRADVEQLEWRNEEEKINLLLFWNYIKTNLMEFVEYERQINEIDLILFSFVRSFFLSSFLLLLLLYMPFYLTLYVSLPVIFVTRLSYMYICDSLKVQCFEQMYWIQKQKHTMNSLCWMKKKIRLKRRGQKEKEKKKAMEKNLQRNVKTKRNETEHNITNEMEHSLWLYRVALLCFALRVVELWYTFDETNGDKNRNNVGEKKEAHNRHSTVNLCDR